MRSKPAWVLGVNSLVSCLYQCWSRCTLHSGNVAILIMRQVCHGRDKCFELTRLWGRGIILIFTSFLRTSRSNQSCEHPGNCRPIQSISPDIEIQTRGIQDSCLPSLMALIVLKCSFPRRTKNKINLLQNVTKVCNTLCNRCKAVTRDV